MTETMIWISAWYIVGYISWIAGCVLFEEEIRIKDVLAGIVYAACGPLMIGLVIYHMENELKITNTIIWSRRKKTG